MDWRRRKITPKKRLLNKEVKKAKSKFNPRLVLTGLWTILKYFLGLLSDPPISESFESSPVTHSPCLVEEICRLFFVAAAAGAATEERQLCVWFIVLYIFMVFFLIIRLRIADDNLRRIYYNLRFCTWLLRRKFIVFVEERRLPRSFRIHLCKNNTHLLKCEFLFCKHLLLSLHNLPLEWNRLFLFRLLSCTGQ